MKDNDYRILEAMSVYGGSFVKLLLLLLEWLIVRTTLSSRLRSQIFGTVMRPLFVRMIKKSVDL